jgi:hypothetical protein
LVEAEPEDSEEIEALDEADIVEALEGPAEAKMPPSAPEPEAELEELEAAELELGELELVEPEELEAVDEPATNRPEAPGDPAGAEAALEERGAVEPGPDEPGAKAPPAADRPDVELEELEAVGPEFIEPDFGRPGIMKGYRGIILPEFEDSDEPETAMDNLVRAIEFSPDSQELEQEKEKAAKSMAEHFKIQSPFASIFSTLSEVEFEPEPMEDLESLEREWLAPDKSPEREVEDLQFSFGPQLSVPFLGALNGEITPLTAEDEDEDLPAAPEEAAADGVITERDGVNYINESVLRPDKETLKGLDKNFKNLIDSILNNT